MGRLGVNAKDHERSRPGRAGLGSTPINHSGPAAGGHMNPPGYLANDTFGTSPQPSQDIGASTYRIAGLPFSSKLSSIVR